MPHQHAATSEHAKITDRVKLRSGGPGVLTPGPPDLSGQVDGWDLRGDRLSAARLRILPDNAVLIAALDELNSAGKSLGAYWREGNSNPDDFEARQVRYKSARAGFLDASRAVVRTQLIR